MGYVASSISLGNFRRAVVVGLALAGSGCGIGEALVAAAQNAADELVAAALESVRETAQAAGGDAVEIGPEGGQLAFADAAHPLYKTKVVIPAAALPEGVERAVLSVVPDPSYALPGTEWAALGPVAQIRLQALPGFDDVELVTAATVQVPVTVETDSDIWLAHGVEDGLTILDSTDADAGAVAGLTTSFSPFVAVGEAPPPGTPDQPETPLNKLTYAVTQTSATVCSGGPFSPTAGTHEAWLVLTGSGLSTMDLQFVVNSGGEGEVGFYGMSVTPATHGRTDFPIVLSRADFSGVDQWVYCGGGSPYQAFNYDGTGAPIFALTLKSFEVTSSTTAADCGDSGTETCKRSFGRLWYRLTMEFDDSADPSFAASASFDGVINGARWETALP